MAEGMEAKIHNDPFISIVIPVYNEERRIRGFLTEVITYLTSCSFSHEIIIVDDGSTDCTIRVAEEILSAYRSGAFTIIPLGKNQGKGGAIKKGMRSAHGQYVFFIDADGSTSIKEIDAFIPAFEEKYPIYIAIRTKKHYAPLKRKLFGYGYIYLANLILGIRIKDYTCGFKCYRKDIIETVFSKQTLNNWSFDAENLFVAKKNNYEIKEIPVYWKHVGGSKVKVLKNVLLCGFDLFRIRVNNLCGNYAH